MKQLGDHKPSIMSTTTSYDLRLTSDHFISDYDTFRNATSQNYTYNKNNYRAVYLTDSDYAYLNIHSGNDVLTLIINLEFYYVYGFKIDGQYFAYKGEAYESLTAAGWNIPTSNILPFGDAYYDIASYDQIDAVRVEKVTFGTLQDAISQVIDLKIDWMDKRKNLLRIFWCLIEGVRFQEISRIMNDLINGTDYNTTFGYFYYMAERWAQLSVGAAYLGKVDSSIAVYELHRLEPYSK